MKASTYHAVEREMRKQQIMRVRRQRAQEFSELMAVADRVVKTLEDAGVGVIDLRGTPRH